MSPLPVPGGHVEQVSVTGRAVAHLAGLAGSPGLAAAWAADVRGRGNVAEAAEQLADAIGELAGLLDLLGVRQVVTTVYGGGQE